MPEWPRLSETLTHPRSLYTCQACGRSGADEATFSRWMEHDAQDKPEPIVVVLCRPCAAKLIEPHPRLYKQLSPNEPMPGAMPICDGCKHRDWTRCHNPLAQINGGPGLTMKFPKPSSVHVCRSPRSQSGWIHHYPGPVTECSGLEVDDAAP